MCGHLEDVDSPLAVHIQHVKRRLEIVQQRAEYLVQQGRPQIRDVHSICMCITGGSSCGGGEGTQEGYTRIIAGVKSDAQRTEFQSMDPVGTSGWD